MSNVTFNAGIDYFSLVSGTSNALKVVSSNENRSKQSMSGANCYGDAAVVDSWGETAAPSSEYQVVAAITHSLASPKITLGSLVAAADSNISIGGTAVPVVLGGCTIRTQNGSAPTISVNGQAVQVGATVLRTYVLPAFSLSSRHRAQDIFSLCTIKKESSDSLAVADPITDYGLEDVSANLPIEFSLAQPKGVLMGYDLHGGMATCDYSMNWYASGEPTIVLAGSVAFKGTGNTTVTATPTMSEPVSKACPEGYMQYTWQVSFPMLGLEAA